MFIFNVVVVDLPTYMYYILSFLFPAETEVLVPVFSRSTDVVVVNFVVVLMTEGGRGTGFSVLSARKMKREPKNERVGRGMEVSFLPSPPTRSLTRPIFRTVIDSLFSFFAPKPHRTLATQDRVVSLLRNHTETLATQA